jgi:perosamine synthetase
MFENKLIPVYSPFLVGKESDYVKDCIASTWISSKGSYLERFETAFAKYIEVDYATTVSNGTVAIHLALESAGIGIGDEVIVPTLTYVACANAIINAGAKPVFVDSDQATWQIDLKDVERKITKKTKAVMAVHLYGLPCDMDALVSLCNHHNLILIEDCAEAFGTKYDGRHVGSFGKVATFSFFGNKTITTGEGGMVVSNDEEIIRRAKSMKSQSVSSTREYWHDAMGYNYRMTNICAAIGLAQLENADQILSRKKEIANSYIAGLSDLRVTFQEEKSKTQHSYWMNAVLLSSDLSRDLVRASMLKAGIETRPVFYPVNKMPHMNNNEFFLNAEKISSAGINLPSHPGLSDQQVAYIIDCLRKEIS